MVASKHWIKRIMKSKLKEKTFVRAGVYSKIALVVDSHLDKFCDAVIEQAELQDSVSIMPHHVDAAVFKLTTDIKNEEE